jgi:hypothetical protein
LPSSWSPRSTTCPMWCGPLDQEPLPPLAVTNSFATGPPHFERSYTWGPGDWNSSGPFLIQDLWFNIFAHPTCNSKLHPQSLSKRKWVGPFKIQAFQRHVPATKHGTLQTSNGKQEMSN